jgi:nitrite reductase/ring-hydroxylating ferredoxin subunit
MSPALTQEEKIKRGAEDSGRYFRYMAEYVGFSESDARAIRESALIIEKYIPDIVGKFYAQLLRYPPTRKYFIRSDGSVDQDYLQLRMHHLTNFWRRTSSGIYDDDYARYVDYVGRSHTSHGADPHIYIHERYVIGQVGFVQHAISEAISKELHTIDPDWENRALLAWTKLMMVILEMLARAYGNERDPDTYAPRGDINHEAVFDLAVQAYEMGLGMRLPSEAREVRVGEVAEIPEGERKIIQVEDLSIGVFHHKGAWIALRNSCLHRGGPVCTGTLNEDILICPWHGYQYNLLDGKLLADPSAALEKYKVEVRDDQVFLSVPLVEKEVVNLVITERQPEIPTQRELQENEFHTADVPPRKTTLVYVDDEPVAVCNAEGTFYAIQNACTHAEGPLSEGALEGVRITCPWHGSIFDVTTGKVLHGPATQPVKTYQVLLEGGTGRVEER